MFFPSVFDRGATRRGNDLPANRDMGALFDRLFNPEWVWTGGANYPVDIREDENNLYIDAEMPGFKKDQVEITMENGVLGITAERTDEEAKGEQHLQERRVTRYARRFSLPTQIDENKIEARMEDGVLKLTLAKREEVKPRKITVK